MSLEYTVSSTRVCPKAGRGSTVIFWDYSSDITIIGSLSFNVDGTRKVSSCMKTRFSGCFMNPINPRLKKLRKHGTVIIYQSVCGLHNRRQSPIFHTNNMFCFHGSFRSSFLISLLTAAEAKWWYKTFQGNYNLFRRWRHLHKRLQWNRKSTLVTFDLLSFLHKKSWIRQLFLPHLSVENVCSGFPGAPSSFSEATANLKK